MADDRNAPWGDAKAPLSKDEKTVWIDLGPVWRSDKDGSLAFTLLVEPLHWRTHNAERRIVIFERTEREPEQQRGNGGGSSSGRGKR